LLLNLSKVEIFIIFILTFLNGIFALSEIALVSVKRHNIEQKAVAGNKRAQIVLNLLDKPENFLSSVQVGITLIGVVAGAYGALQLVDNIEPIFQNIAFLKAYSRELSFTFIIGIITYFSIVVGELIPKSIALNNPEGVALAFGPIINFFSYLTYPLVKVLSFSTKVILKLIGIEDNKSADFSSEELLQLLKNAGKQGVIEREESVFHQNVFDFYEQTAENLKIHRTEVELINANDDFEKIKNQVKKSIFSKFPVYMNTIDEIVGVVTAKDFFEHVKSKEDFKKIIKKPILIPEMLSAVEVLRIFKERKEHLGIIVDEHGSFEGILTLHDLIESIVGNLSDSKFEVDPDFYIRKDNSVLVSGSVEIKEINEYFNVELIAESSENYMTLAGFVIYFLDRIPNVGESFEYNNYYFEIVDIDGNRIDKVVLKKIVVEKL